MNKEDVMYLKEDVEALMEWYGIMDFTGELKFKKSIKDPIVEVVRWRESEE